MTIQYQKLISPMGGSVSFTLNGAFIPEADDNPDYRVMMERVANGEAEILEPEGGE